MSLPMYGRTMDVSMSEIAQRNVGLHYKRRRQQLHTIDDDDDDGGGIGGDTECGGISSEQTINGMNE